VDAFVALFAAHGVVEVVSRAARFADRVEIT
jgi:hypothetical protein